jgi:hypothetical protein
MQYRNGTFTSAAAAVNLNLGFLPDRVTTTNWTALATDATAVIQSDFYRNATPAGYASRLSKTITTGAVTQANVTSNGFTLINLGGAWQSTQYTITGVTKANPGVVTVTSLSPTNTLTLVNGMTVTISGVVGMTQLNQNRYIVSGITGSTFTLYDLFGNPLDTSAFGTYSSGGIVNQISYPATAPTIDATTGQISAQGNPAGNQYDTGYQGITLGTGVVGASTNLIFWEAWTMTPTGW